MPCKFEVRFVYDKTNQKFTLNDKKSTFIYSHPLNLDEYMTEEHIKYLEVLIVEKNSGPKEVREKINAKFSRKFDYTTVKNAYQRTKIKLFGTVNNDAINLIELLEALQKKQYLKYEKLLSSQGHLRGLVFATEGMLSLYEQYNDMIILDTTFGLNRFNMPLLTIAGIKNDEKTIILAFALLLDESYEIKAWVLKTYLSFVSNPPKAAISDACPALIKSLEEVFNSTKLYLCAWHVQLNLKKHLSGFKKTLLKKGKSLFYFVHII